MLIFSYLFSLFCGTKTWLSFFFQKKKKFYWVLRVIQAYRYILTKFLEKRDIKIYLLNEYDLEM